MRSALRENRPPQRSASSPGAPFGRLPPLPLGPVCHRGQPQSRGISRSRARPAETGWTRRVLLRPPGTAPVRCERPAPASDLTPELRPAKAPPCESTERSRAAWQRQWPSAKARPTIRQPSVRPPSCAVRPGWPTALRGPHQHRGCPPCRPHTGLRDALPEPDSGTNSPQPRPAPHASAPGPPTGPHPTQPAAIGAPTPGARVPEPGGRLLEKTPSRRRPARRSPEAGRFRRPAGAAGRIQSSEKGTVSWRQGK